MGCEAATNLAVDSLADVEPDDCVQFAPNLLVPGTVKALVEASATTRMNVCGLGADIF